MNEESFRSTHLPLGAAELNEEQWSQIVRDSGLPDRARIWVGSAIASYRNMAHALAPSGADTRETLRSLAKRTKNISDELRNLPKNPRAAVALTKALHPSPLFMHAMNKQIVNGRLEETSDSLVEISDWLAAAAEALKRSRPGSHEKSLLVQLLVMGLDQILIEFTGEGISRSQKRGAIGRDYITTVCKIADRTIGASSIEEAMKKQITARGKSTSEKQA